MPSALSRKESTPCVPLSGASWSSPTTNAPLDYIRPDVVHVLADGRIVRTGGGELVDELESRGYEFLKETETAEKA